MSTKSKIYKVRNKVWNKIQAHEDHKWQKGYEKGLAEREDEVIKLQERIKNIATMNALLLVGLLAVIISSAAIMGSNKSSSDTTIPANISLESDTSVTGEERTDDATEGRSSNEQIQELDNQRDTARETLPEPDWLDAPAVIAWSKWDDVRREKIWSNDEEHYKSTDGEIATWKDLRTVTPLYPKETEK